MTLKTSKETNVSESSGNVFADLRLPNPEQAMMKARLTLQIYLIVQDRGLTQADTAKILGIELSRVSPLMRNRASSLSIDRLTEFLAALGPVVTVCGA